MVAGQARAQVETVIHQHPVPTSRVWVKIRGTVASGGVIHWELNAKVCNDCNNELPTHVGAIFTLPDTGHYECPECQGTLTVVHATGSVPTRATCNDCDYVWVNDEI